MDLAAARNLSERLDTPLVEPTEPDSAALRRARVWRDNATRGDDELFRRRLSEWTELDPARFVASLQQSVPATEMSWPPPDTAWADTAWADTSWADVLTDLPHGSTTEPGDHLGPLVAPLIARAWELVADARAPLGPLSRQALEDLSRDLGQQVSRLIQTAVDTDFREQPAGWQEYRQSLLTTDLTALWVRYPVLARLVGRLLQRWSVGTSELLHRFVADRDIIAEITGSSPDTILGVIPSLSDPHNGGRRVTVLEFAGGQGGPCGTRVVYKPKDLSAEMLWSAVVTWADSHGLDLGPPARVASEKDHGWVEFVPSAPTCDPGLFFHRAGALTALVFALGGGDCHAENLIAAGDRPVVVDAETVLQPTIRDESGSQHSDNVLDTLLLPRWLRIGGRPVDLSPLGGSGVGWIRRELTWENPETDAARLVPRLTPGIPHGATDIDGHLMRAPEYTAELIEGFRRGWEVLRVHRQSLISGPLSHMPDVRVRVLVRMTRAYTRVAETSLHPRLFGHGLDRSIHLEHLARFVMDRADWRSAVRLTDIERDQMEDGDIPFFTVRGDDDILRSDTGEPLLPLAESAQQRALRRLATLDDGQRARQEELIVTSLRLAPPNTRADVMASACDEGDPQDSSLDLTSAAMELERLLDRILRQTTGAPVGLVAVGPEQWGVEQLTPGWYDGTTGVAVALAVAGLALKHPAATDRARELLTRELTSTTNLASRWWRSRGPGGQDGVGGMLFGWAMASRLLPDLEAPVGKAVARMLAQRVEPQPAADLLSGSLGLVAGLVAARGAGIPVDQGIAQAIVATTETAVREYLTQRGVNGFSHGNSGMAAVLDAAGVAGWASDESLVTRCLDAESRRFDTALGDWHDLRRGPDAGPGPGWCNGAAGLALARLLCGDPTKDLPRLRPLVTRDVQARDNLCCGSTGRAEILRIWMTVDPTMKATYEACVNGVIERVNADRLRLGVPEGLPIQPIGLFQGLAGPVITLAAAMAPQLPAVLAWGHPTGEPSAAVLPSGR